MLQEFRDSPLFSRQTDRNDRGTVGLHLRTLHRTVVEEHKAVETQFELFAQLRHVSMLRFPVHFPGNKIFATQYHFFPVEHLCDIAFFFFLANPHNLPRCFCSSRNACNARHSPSIRTLAAPTSPATPPHSVLSASTTMTLEAGSRTVLTFRARNVASAAQ